MISCLVEVGRAVLAAHAAGELPDPTDAGFADAWKGWVKGVGKELGRKGKDLFTRGENDVSQFVD